MILISATPSPFARKVRIALIEKGIPFELRNEIPWHSDTETPRHNPLEQLPILIPDEGEPVYESTYILEWIEHTYPDPPLVPADTGGMLEAKRIAMISEAVMDATVHLFFEFQRPEPSQDWIVRQLRKVRGGLSELDRRLGNKRYFVADQFGLADLSTISVLGMQDVASSNGALEAWQQMDPLMDDWRTLCPNLSRYEADLSDRPSVRDTAPVMFQLAERIV